MAHMPFHLSRRVSRWFVLGSLLLQQACNSAPAANAAGARSGAAAVGRSSAALASRGGRIAPQITAGGAPLLAPVASERAPWLGLTASDGSGLELTKLHAQTVIEGPLALTELHLYFRNPMPQVREGKFRITLPEGAAISRFAMENESGFMEAEVVPKAKARQVYEDFLHQRRDPALLEQAQGNEFSARVFPIAGNAMKHLVVTFSQELTGQGFRLPLAGLPNIADLSARLLMLEADGTYRETKMAKQQWRPDADIVAAPSPVMALRAGDLVAMRVKLTAPQAEYRPQAVQILVDTSASRALGFAADVARVQQLVAELAQRLGGQLPLEVVAFDQTAEVVFSGTAAEAMAATKVPQTSVLTQRLQARGALGASNLEAAFAAVQPAPHTQVIVLSDAVVTAGGDAQALRKQIAALQAKGVERVDVALVGGIRDSALAKTVTLGAAPIAGAVLDVDALGVAETARRLGVSVVSDLAVSVNTATWVWPASVSGQHGDEVVVYVRQAPAEEPYSDVNLRLGAQQIRALPVDAAPALLERAHARGKVSELQAAMAMAPDANTREALRAQIVALSMAQRVMSSEASFLVLETEEDYARFGLARTARAGILVVGPQGILVADRRPSTLPATPAQIATSPNAASSRNQAKDMKAKPASAAAPQAQEKMQAEQGEAPREANTGLREQDKADSAAVTDGFGLGRQGIGPGGGGASVSAPGMGAARAGMGAARAAEGRAATASHDEPTDEVVARPRPSATSGVSALAAPPPSPPPPPPPSARPVTTPQRDEARRERIATGADADRATTHDRSARRMPDVEAEALDDNEATDGAAALTGTFAVVMQQLRAGEVARARTTALTWQTRDPGDVLALIARGEVAEAERNWSEAARAYGSLIDLYADRADLRRFAGQRLARVAAQHAAAGDLMLDSFRRAVADRPDHPSSHRMYAFALARAGRFAEAFAALRQGLIKEYPGGRFAGVREVLLADLGVLGAAWIAQAPNERAQVMAQLTELGAQLATQASTRFVLYWETDANDVDFHIRDARGGHAYYSQPTLASGGRLFADVTTGYGPECFEMRGKPSAGPYRLSIHYYARGPMGYGMGAVEVMRHEGGGKLRFETRPYVVMNDHAYVDLGVFQP